MVKHPDEEIVVENANRTTIFAVRTTIGQEKSVLNILFNKLRVMNPFPDLKAMMISDQLRGYIFIEAIHQREVMATIAGVPHIKGKVVGSIKLESIAHVIQPRRVTEVLEEGDEVEIVSGIFASQHARVIRMPKEGAREEVTLRLLGSDSDISIKIHGDFLKLVAKGEKRKEKYEFTQVEPGITPVINEPSTSQTISESDNAIEDLASKVIIDTVSAEGSKASAFDFGEETNLEEEISTESSEKGKKQEKKKEKPKIEEGEEEEDEWSKFSY
jgi:transcription elongation factor Spt5